MNVRLNAFVHVDVDGALRAADAIDSRRSAGEKLPPLAGVPFGVKDLEDCAGMPTTHGSRWYASAGPAERDDIHVARFRAAGAIPIGKDGNAGVRAWGYTASPLLGVTRNPWNTDRTPGGTAAARRRHGGGVVRNRAVRNGERRRRFDPWPGSSCGLPGLKPTYGRAPTFGVTRQAQNAVNFALATTVADTAALFDVAVGPDTRDRTSLPAPGVRYSEAIERLDVTGFRATWSADLGFVVVDPEVCTELATFPAHERLIMALRLSHDRTR